MEPISEDPADLQLDQALRSQARPQSIRARSSEPKACTSCRKRKRRCDGGRPSCSHCVKLNQSGRRGSLVVCEYPLNAVAPLEHRLSQPDLSLEDPGLPVSAANKKLARSQSSSCLEMSTNTSGATSSINTVINNTSSPSSTILASGRITKKRQSDAGLPRSLASIPESGHGLTGSTAPGSGRLGRRKMSADVHRTHSAGEFTTVNRMGNLPHPALKREHSDSSLFTSTSLPLTPRADTTPRGFSSSWDTLNNVGPMSPRIVNQPQNGFDNTEGSSTDSAYNATPNLISTAWFSPQMPNNSHELPSWASIFANNAQGPPPGLNNSALRIGNITEADDYAMAAAVVAAGISLNSNNNLQLNGGAGGDLGVDLPFTNLSILSPALPLVSHPGVGGIIGNGNFSPFRRSTSGFDPLFLNGIIPRGESPPPSSPENDGQRSESSSLDSTGNQHLYSGTMNANIIATSSNATQFNAIQGLGLYSDIHGNGLINGNGHGIGNGMNNGIVGGIGSGIGTNRGLIPTPPLTHKLNPSSFMPTQDTPFSMSLNVLQSIPGNGSFSSSSISGAEVDPPPAGLSNADGSSIFGAEPLIPFFEDGTHLFHAEDNGMNQNHPLFQLNHEFNELPPELQHATQKLFSQPAVNEPKFPASQNDFGSMGTSGEFDSSAYLSTISTTNGIHPFSTNPFTGNHTTYTMLDSSEAAPVDDDLAMMIGFEAPPEMDMEPFGGSIPRLEAEDPLTEYEARQGMTSYL